MGKLTAATQIEFAPSAEALEAQPVHRAIAMLRRDLDWALTAGGEPGVPIRLEGVPGEAESYRVTLAGGALVVAAADVLGAVYGLLAISEKLLGVHPFWLWMNQRVDKRKYIALPEDLELASRPYAVRYRGWFVNDEVLLAAWKIEGDAAKPWEMVFEALLRCGGNMVIPGTDRNAVRYRQLAADMGLAITHHHAEPLGAEMFARAHPGLRASYREHPELFEDLWRQAIARQRGMRVLWNLGFRGQGDEPFWQNDAFYDTDEKRGALISQLIRRQYDILRAEDPVAVCCTNLYGEVMELYQKGLIDLPPDVVRIWADNGYGRIVSRRQGNHDPRVPSLPQQAGGANGLYYHVSFYDLQAANHITMLPAHLEMVAEELAEALAKGVGEYWVINCSNVKPHVFFLAAVAELWREGALEAESFRQAFARLYCGAAYAAPVAECYRAYADCAVQFGPHRDQRAGDQFPNHGTRVLATAWVVDKNRPAQDFLWACNADTLQEQIEWYAAKCGEAAERYGGLVCKCEALALAMEEVAAAVLEENLLLQARVYACCYRGAVQFCHAHGAFVAGDLQRAFYFAGRAADEYAAGNAALRQSEHGRWIGFWANDCQTDVKQTAWVLQGLMAWLRTLGDGPHYYEWQREFLYAEEDRRIRLLLTNENHLTDQELYLLMRQRWEC